MRKGQFMIISAIVAGVITISLSISIAEIQSKTYEPSDTSDTINQIKKEIKKVTADGKITEEEEENLRKTFSFIEEYRVEAKVKRDQNCIKTELKKPGAEMETACIN